jgi:L-ascorbate metabolism protein UlaG (beta-lactamase superfamily)
MSKNRQTGSRGKRPVLQRIRRAAKAARSGLKRYPKALLASVRDPRGRRLAHLKPKRGLAPDLAGHDLAAAWLGHASVLVRIAGLNVLADPVFEHRIGVSVGPMTFGLARHGPAPVHTEDLPPIDLLLISHAHFDHLDKPTLRRLARVGQRTTVVTARQTARLIPPGFGRVLELDWGQTLKLGHLSLGAIRPEHWGARTALDRRRGYNSYVLRARRGGVLLAGDTAYTDAFDRLDDLALAVLGIGAYEPWEHVHATPEEVWKMFRACGAGHLLPVHHSTFPLGNEHIDEPMRRLLAAARPDEHRVIRAAPGGVWAA